MHISENYNYFCGHYATPVPTAEEIF